MTGPLVLGIESSCDETAVALVRGDRTILSQRIASQKSGTSAASSQSI
jgi:N6-L-threonylcarbamoyladenine synthase